MQGINFIESLDEVLNAVCNAAGVSIAAVRSKLRNKDVVLARQVYCYFAKIKTRKTYMEIGAMLGSYTHSTVIHSITAVNDKLFVHDRAVTNLVGEVKKILQFC